MWYSGTNIVSHDHGVPCSRAWLVLCHTLDLRIVVHAHVAALLFWYPQYFDDSYATVKEQRAFESSLFQKTQRANGVYQALFSGSTRPCLGGRLVVDPVHRHP